MNEIFLLSTVSLLAYLIGSIPFGYLLVKLVGKGDVRETGSGSTGATNAMRVGGKFIALLTLLLDAGKGLLVAYGFLYAVFFSGPYGLLMQALMLSAVLLGHMYPIWLKWKGGKGFATFIGITIGYSFLFPYVAQVLLGTWIAIFLLTRISSLSALTGIVVTNLFMLFYHQEFMFIYMGLSLLVIHAHRANIKRLLKGEELRFKR